MSATVSSSKAMTRGTESGRKQHCWECRRRRLVCDFAQPTCRRCSDAGVVCPGYSDTKPLQIAWLEPGRVKSKTKVKPKKNDDGDESAECDAVISIPRFDIAGDDLKISKQAVDYYNQVMLPDLLPTLELGGNKDIYFISPSHFQVGVARPVYIRHGIVCLAVNHRMSRLRNEPQSKELENTYLRFRGMMLRSLAADISVQNKCTMDNVLAGILTLLFQDAYQGLSSHWRCHIQAAYKFIAMRGGLRLLNKTPGIDSLVLSFLFTAVCSDTSSPAWDQIIAPPNIEDLDFIINQLDDSRLTFKMYPVVLFAEIFRINYLRMLASTGKVTKEHANKQACDILSRVQTFSSEQWAQTKPTYKEDWILMGDSFRGAVALYCISSMQSVGILTSTKTTSATEAHLLQTNLSKGCSSPRVKRLMFWPMMVLGVEAVHGGLEMRNFVREQLGNMCSYFGTYSALHLKDVLERFWGSGRTGWDDCFDVPYNFTSQMAVNSGSIKAFKA